MSAMLPGAHLLSFAGTRTQHRMAIRIEDAGFEIRDMIAWVYGSGFPKSLNIGKALDKAAGAVREVVGRRTDRAATPKQDIRGGRLIGGVRGGIDCSAITAPATDEAKQWDGFGTALKPSLEPITLARKPLSEATVAANVLLHGTGGINIDGCRIAGIDPANAKRLGRDYTTAETNFGGGQVQQKKVASVGGDLRGRWPANLILTHSEACRCTVAEPAESSLLPHPEAGAVVEVWECVQDCPVMILDEQSDAGGASRFFYCAKSNKGDRGTHTKEALPLFGVDEESVTNGHCTVKPVDLMRYLCRLVTPPGGIALDPWMGSGSTGVAALREGFNFIGIERDEDSFMTACARIRHELEGTSSIATTTK